MLIQQLTELGQLQVLKDGNRDWVLKYYQFVEEFVSIYRMHQLVPDEFNLETFECYLNNNSTNTGIGCEQETIDIEELIHGFNTIELQDEYSHSDLMYSFGAKKDRYSTTITDLFDPTSGTQIDLSTIDLIRQRERGAWVSHKSQVLKN